MPAVMTYVSLTRTVCIPTSFMMQSTQTVTPTHTPAAACTAAVAFSPAAVAFATAARAEAAAA